MPHAGKEALVSGDTSIEVRGRTAAGTLSPALSPVRPFVHIPDSTDHQRACCLQGAEPVSLRPRARRPCHDLTRNPGPGHAPSSRTPECPGRILIRHPCSTALYAGDGMDPGDRTKRELAHDNHTPAPPRFLVHTSTISELSFAHGTVSHCSIPLCRETSPAQLTPLLKKENTVTGSSCPAPPASAGQEATPHRPPQAPCHCSQHRRSSLVQGS